MLLPVQSAKKPHQIPISPKPKRRQRRVLSPTRSIHIVQVETIMPNFTSPAARMPLAGTKAHIQKSGLRMLIKSMVSFVRAAVSASMPARRVIRGVAAMASQLRTKSMQNDQRVSFFM